MLRNQTVSGIQVEELEIEEVTLGVKGFCDFDLNSNQLDYDAFQERIELQAARERRVLQGIAREMNPFLM